MSTTLNPGQTTRFQCDECSIQFDLEHEPQARENGTRAEMDSAEVAYCPYCGTPALRAIECPMPIVNLVEKVLKPQCHTWPAATG